MRIYELDEGELFSFVGDKNTLYVYGGCDGHYCKVFSSLKDYKKFKNVAYVEAYTTVKRVLEDDSDYERKF